jgi:GTP cyclohydrolase II
VILLARDRILTRHGTFQESLFYNGVSQSVALTVGDLTGAQDVLCRIHSSCLSAHGLGSISCDCALQMEHAQTEVSKAGRGIIIWLEQEGRSNGHLAKMLAEPAKRRGLPQGTAYEAVGFRADARDYAEAVEILKFFRIESVVLLTNNALKRGYLEGAGMIVSDAQQVPRRAESNGVECDRA